MQVYLKSEQDWIDFVSGKHVVAHKNPIEGYYKEILVAHNEVIVNNENTVLIMKKY